MPITVLTSRDRAQLRKALLARDEEDKKVTLLNIDVKEAIREALAKLNDIEDWDDDDFDTAGLLALWGLGDRNFRESSGTLLEGIKLENLRRIPDYEDDDVAEEEDGGQ